jgi:hypothetical protein
MKRKNVFKAIGAVLCLAVMIVPFKIFAGAASLAALFTFGTVDFNAEEERDLSNIIMQEVFNNPALNSVITIEEGIVADKQIVYMDLLSKITKADAGCGNGVTAKTLTMTQKKWSPKQLKVWLQMCANELDNSLLMYSRAKGTNVKNIIENAPELANFLKQNISQAMYQDVWRIMFFNDTDHTNAGFGSGTEELTVGTSTTDYTMIDGFFKQLAAIIAADPTRRVTIAENAELTYVDQLALGATTGRDVFRDLLVKAHPSLRGAANKKIYTTMTLLDNYAQWLEDQNGNVVSYERNEAGFETLKRRNVEIIGIPSWDLTIQEDFDTGSAWVNPHRALLTTPDNLKFGIDAIAALQELEMWYSKDTEKNNFRGHYRADAKVIRDEKIQYAI